MSDRREREKAELEDVHLGGFNGFFIEAVPAGTPVTDDDTGETLTVTEETAVIKGQTVYVTPATHERLKASPKIKAL